MRLTHLNLKLKNKLTSTFFLFQRKLVANKNKIAHMLEFPPLQTHQPNFTTFDSPEIQEGLPKAEKTRERYRELAATFPALTAGWLPALGALYQLPVPHFAATQGSLEQIEKLDKLVEGRDMKGLTPLHYALAFGRKDAIRILIEKTDLNYITPAGNSYLHHAALTGDPEILALFLERGIDPTLRNRTSLSAAHLWAMTSNDLDGLHKLMPKNADKELFEFTPLELMTCKALENDNRLSDIEWNLFYANIADLGIVALSLLLVWQKSDDLPIWLAAALLGYLHSFATLGKGALISKLATEQLASIAHPNQALLVRFSSWLTGSRIGPTLQSSLAGIAVAWHMLKNMPQLTQVSWSSALRTMGVRCFNTLCSVIDTGLSYSYPQYDPSYDPTYNSAVCQAVEPELIQRMPLLHRFVHPFLTRGLKGNLAHYLYPEQCLANFRNFLPNGPTLNCSETFLQQMKSFSDFIGTLSLDDPAIAMASENAQALLNHFCPA